MAGRQIDFEALADFRYEIRRFLNFSERAARLAGIEPQQHQALLAIKGQPAGEEISIGALAAGLLVRHHTAVELIDRLEKNGLVRRSRSSKDGRRADLRLTKRGERVLESLSVEHRNELDSSGPRLIKALESVLAHKKRLGRTKARRSG